MKKMFLAAVAALSLATAVTPVAANTASIVARDARATRAQHHAQAAAPATERLASPVSAGASSPDAPAPTNAGRGKNIIFVGFGWG